MQPGASTAAGPGGVELSRLRGGRLARLRREMAKQEIAACVLLDPVNIRYATGARNMQVFMLRNPARYLFLPLEGPVILFEFEGCHHLARDLETIDEIRPAITVSSVASGPRLDENARAWTDEIVDLFHEHCGRGGRIGVERIYVRAAMMLAAAGLDLADAQAPVERARSIKSAEEIACIRASIAATERGVARMRSELRPGITENGLWAHLHAAVIEQDGDYVETRLLSSGPRTNPWFQEAGPRPIEAGELVALDTDVVGCHGYYADFSRTFLCGDGRPTDEQGTLYRLAFDQIHHNVALIRPGLSFRELAERAWPIPERFVKNRYFVLAHGVGMTGEYPYILHRQDIDRHGYDGVIEEGMALCVESYIGAEDGREGVKLEQQILVTATGAEPLSRFPFEERLLGRAL